MEYMGRVEDGLPVLDVRAHAWLPGPRVAGIIYVHPLTIQILDEDGTLTDSNAVLSRARELGWVLTSDFAGWAAPCPGWETSLTGDHLLVRQPDGAAWYDGTLPASEAWRTAVQETGRVFHFTAACGDVDSIGAQISCGQALAVVSRFI